MSKANNPCVFCGVKQYGPGCPYSPHGKHVVIEIGRCIYCGLRTTGPGCAYSPTGMHVQSSTFGLIQAESARDHFIMKYLMEKLKEDPTKTRAYELGIINEQGEQIRDLQNEADRRAWSPVARYITRLKRIFSEKLDLLNTELFLEQANTEIVEDNVGIDWDPVEYIKKTEQTEILTEDLERMLEEYYNRLKQANKDGFSDEQVEKILMKILNDNISNHHS